MTIKYKEITEGCAPVINKNGDAFDLVLAKNIRLIKGQYTVLPLGIAMEIPKGFIANVRPRSSSFSKFNVIQANSVGLIDSTYCGDNDQWGMPVIGYENKTLVAGSRVCQFEIMPSCRATVWQKLKWLFSNGIKFIKVEHLNNPDRGGFGEGTKHVDK